jgi:hypothetical protein
MPFGLSESAHTLWRDCLVEIRSSKKADQALRQYQYASSYLQALRDAGAVDLIGFRLLRAQLTEEWVAWADSH